MQLILEENFDEYFYNKKISIGKQHALYRLEEIC